MASARRYCPECKKWYHLVGAEDRLRKVDRDGCLNCGSELLKSEILVRPNDAGDLVLSTGVPFPEILFAPEIETLRDGEKYPRDHSFRILNLVFGEDWDEGDTLFDRISKT